MTEDIRSVEIRGVGVEMMDGFITLRADKRQLEQLAAQILAEIEPDRDEDHTEFHPLNELSVDELVELAVRSISSMSPGRWFELDYILLHKIRRIRDAGERDFEESRRNNLIRSMVPQLRGWCRRRMSDEAVQSIEVMVGLTYCDIVETLTCDGRPFLDIWGASPFHGGAHFNMAPSWVIQSDHMGSDWGVMFGNDIAPSGGLQKVVDLAAEFATDHGHVFETYYGSDIFMVDRKFHRAWVQV